MQDLKVYDGSGWQSLKGPPGPSEPSKDAGNEIKKGSDGLLLAPYRGLDYLHWGSPAPSMPPDPLPHFPLLWLDLDNGSLWWYRPEISATGTPQAWEPVLDKPILYLALLEGEDGSYWDSRYTRTLSGDVTLIVNYVGGGGTGGPAINTLLGLPHAADTGYPSGDPWLFFGKALIDDGGGNMSIVPVTIRTGEDWLTINAPSATYAALLSVEITYRTSEVTYR